MRHTHHPLLAVLAEAPLVLHGWLRIGKADAASIKEWAPLDAHHSTASFQLQLHGWSKQRRFVVIRELEREYKSAVGRQLIEVPGYTHLIL